MKRKRRAMKATAPGKKTYRERKESMLIDEKALFS